jgi:hypothetical protein
MTMVRKKRRTNRSRAISGVIGATLLLIGVLGFAWLIVYRPHSLTIPTSIRVPGLVPASAPEVQLTPLLAAGITLGHADQQPTLNQQQALLIASQMEPDAASKARKTSARYVLLNYPGSGTPGTRTALKNVPVWMVWYQQVPLQPADAAVDPTPFPHSYHDLYVFLDANSGKELLSIWI